jgi:hypothetical protein
LLLLRVCLVLRCLLAPRRTRIEWRRFLLAAPCGADSFGERELSESAHARIEGRAHARRGAGKDRAYDWCTRTRNDQEDSHQQRDHDHESTNVPIRERIIVRLGRVLPVGLIVAIRI